MIKWQILILSKDPVLRQSLRCILESDTVAVHCVPTLSDTVYHMTRANCCLVITDLRISGVDNLEMIRILRLTKLLPILAIGTSLKCDDLVALYRAGLGSYMEYPIDVEICAAQAEALIRLYLEAEDKSRKQDTLAFGKSLIISPQYRQVLIEGRQINLTRKEFDLLLYLAQHPHQVFNAGQLYEQVWDEPLVSGDSTVIVHVNTLRKKLGIKVIETMRGFGYRFIPPPDPDIS